MTSREHLLKQQRIRTWRINAVFGIFFVLITSAFAYGFHIPPLTTPVFLVLYVVVLVLIQTRGVTCPQCEHYWGPIGRRADLSPKSKKKMNFCPYCASSLETAVPDGLKAPNVSAAAVVASLPIAMIALAIIYVDRAIISKIDPVRTNPKNSVVMYSAEWCESCKRVKACLEDSGIPFQEKNIETSREAFAEHWALGGRGIPVTIIGEEVVVGLDKAHLKSALESLGFTVRCWDAQQVTAADV